jgi:glycerophosphoryl diester phosphodiesterase
VHQVRRAAEYPYFDNGGLPIAFAHRGGRISDDGYAFENTMRAFERAVELGYRYLETDAHTTLDGVLLAFHDATVHRTTGSDGSLSDLPYDDVRPLRIGGTEPIPLMHELLAAWPDVRINIDAKSTACVAPLAAVIGEHRAWDRVCVASFSPRRLRQLREVLGPRVATAYAAAGVAAMRFLPTRRLRRVCLGASGLVAQVPVRKNGIEVVTPAFVAHAHALGKQVHVWTVDAAPEIDRLLDLGVDAIMADRIDVLRDVYRSRGIWKA